MATERQRQAWEATVRLGSQSAAAREMGTSQGVVRSLMIGYARSIGWTDPLPGVRHDTGRPEGTGRVQVLTRQLEEAHEEIDRLRSELAMLHGGIEAKLDELLSRPATTQVVEWRPNHRRVVDGGTQVRRQRREMRERAAG